MTATTSSPTRQPVLFIGHGSPMNAIQDTPWGRGWRTLGDGLTPRAILAVSAHWYGAGTFVTGQAAPPTIHDFGGFPRPLFEMQYPARGDIDLATKVAALVRTQPPTTLNDHWGLDHGTWSVLVHLRPKADVPVIQLSIDGRLPPAAHVDIGRALAPLRDEGVLILGSGNVTHNLREAMGAMRSGDTHTPAWASRFDGDVTRALDQRDLKALVRLVDTDDGRRAHPSPDHWLPLLYAAGAADLGVLAGVDDVVSFPTQGFDAGSLSMRSVRFG
jgi:4,5-DOPA dioxygenase extradiol